MLPGTLIYTIMTYDSCGITWRAKVDAHGAEQSTEIQGLHRGVVIKFVFCGLVSSFAWLAYVS